MKVLVIGASGYIGSVLCAQLLNEGYSVIGVDNCLYSNQWAISHLLSYPKKQFEFIQYDVRNLWEIYLRTIRQADIIIPLAALVGGPVCDKYPSWATEINFKAIQRIVDMCGENKRILYPNTNSGYGSSTTECTEETPLAPLSHYAKTKSLAEEEVLRNPNSVSLRLATVCGISPRMRFDLLVNDFSAQMYYNKKITLFEPYFKRNYVHIMDVARAFIWMIQHPKLTGVYNLGRPDANWNKLELATKIREIYFGGNPNVSINIGNGADPDKRDYIISNEKILDTGFKFKHTIEEAIEQIQTFCYLHTQEEVSKMRNI